LLFVVDAIEIEVWLTSRVREIGTKRLAPLDKLRGGAIAIVNPRLRKQAAAND
jgi:hypothetical protein